VASRRNEHSVFKYRGSARDRARRQADSACAVVAILSKRGRRWVVTTRSREAHDIGRADDLVMTSGVLIVVLAGLGAFLVVFAGRALSSAHFAHSLRTQATRDEPAPVPPQGRGLVAVHQDRPDAAGALGRRAGSGR
jgi:hypothetical protein